MGTSDITAEDVRNADNQARMRVLGVDKRDALPDHVFPLVMLDAAGPRKGLTRRERHERWLAYARDWCLYGKHGELRYYTLASYDNYIKKLARKHDWIRRELDDGGYDPEDHDDFTGRR